MRNNIVAVDIDTKDILLVPCFTRLARQLQTQQKPGLKHVIDTRTEPEEKTTQP